MEQMSTPTVPRPPLSTRWLLVATLMLPPILAAACGDEDPGGGDGGAGERQAACPEGFMPLKVGVKWSYRVRDQGTGTFTSKETTVEASEPVPMVSGVTAFKLVTRKGAGLADETVSWQRIDASRVVRYQEQAYAPGVGGGPPTPGLLEWWDPYKLRIDWTAEHTQKGVQWTVSYNESSRDRAGVMTSHARNERWSVEGVNEMVTVAAGTFSTLRVRRVGTDQNASSDKNYWFACGVGKVKESGGQLEELTAVTGR
jgi:hypothetical protein